MAEEMASNSRALRLSLAESDPNDVEPIFDVAQEGDSAAQEIFARVGRALGIALTNLINTLDLPLYVLAGGVAATWNGFSRAMMQELGERCCVFRETPAEIKRSELLNPGLLGAAHYVFQKVKPP